MGSRSMFVQSLARRRDQWLGVALAWLMISGASVSVAADVAGDVRAMTGSQTRLVWMRGGQSLVYFDTDDARGEVEREYGMQASRPIITPTGKQVVFICYERWASYVVDWAGTKPVKLVDGRVTHVRLDEAGAQWIYWQTKDNRILTAPLTSPGDSKQVWSFDWEPRRGKSTNFQTSADGRVAGATFPWPSNGMALIPQDDNDFALLGKGCWPQIARDNSYYFMHCYDGRHLGVIMHAPGDEESWVVRMKPNPEADGCECPRWANDPRFVVVTDRPGGSAVWGVYLGEFNEGFRKIERWVTVSREGRNAQADVWVCSAAKYPAPASAEAWAAVQVLDRAKRLDWPAVTDGLVYVWESLASANEVRDSEGKLVRRCVADVRGGARPWFHASLDMSRGSLDPQGVDKALLAACRDSGALTLEAWVAPESVRPGAGGVLMAFSPDAGPGNVTLEQLGQRLVLRLKSSGAGSVAKSYVLNARLDAAGQHVMLVIGEGRIRLYVDGQARGEAVGYAGDFSNWSEGKLRFGRRWVVGGDWRGRIEGVALYSRALSEAEVTQQHQAASARMYGREEPARAVVTAKLVNKTATPSLEAIQPYPRCLVVYTYDVPGGDGAIKGRIDVAHWAYLDSTSTGLSREVGKTYRLELSPMDDHPHLRSERVVSDSLELDAPMFVDLSR